MIPLSLLALALPPRIVVVLLLLVVAGATAASAKPSQLPFSRGGGRLDGAAPLLSASNAREIDGSYIVVLKPSLPPARYDAHHGWVASLAVDLTGRNPARQNPAAAESIRAGSPWNGVPDSHVRHVYNKHFRGYSGTFSSDLLKRIRESNEVEYVERDQAVYIDDVQRNAPWGLARISHRKVNLRSFHKYHHDRRGGENVTVYVIDTGVNVDHKDFEGRAEWGVTVPIGDEDRDGNGHGSHCAGTIGGRRYGVAKKSKIVAVKVLRTNGSGTMSDVIKGIEYVGERHAQEVMIARSQGRKHRGSVANMSLGGGRSRTLDRVIDAVVAAGVHFSVAAGNDNRDACNYSPAASQSAITVGASTIGDERALFSNYGRCVDIFAPGKDITSAWIGSRVATNTISGTSMASPHIAGLLAYKLSLVAEDKEPPTPKELKDHLTSTCTRGALSHISADTPNCLAYSGIPETATYAA